MKVSQLVFLLFISSSFAFEFVQNYTHSQTINDHYEIHWSLDEEKVHLFLGIVAKTVGWVGFGIGERTSGSMPGADFVVAVMHEGKMNVSDRYSLEYAMPVEDECVDWYLANGFREDGMTVVEVYRALYTDDLQDRDIVPGHNRILWAFGTNDNFAYHRANRGTEVVSFYDAIAPINITSDTELVFRYNDARPPVTKTVYMCQAFKLPNETAHIIQIDPIIDPVSEVYVHHFQLHVCDLSQGQEWEKYQTPTKCGSDVMSRCSSIAFAWALGMGSLVLPDTAGFRSGKDGFQYLVLETHFDNPRMETFVDTSGVRLHITHELREQDAGIMSLGDGAVTLPDIPAGESSVVYQSDCPSECTEKFTHEIRVFASFLHMHTIGKQMMTTIHRDGKSNTTNRIDFYDFNFQQITETDYTIRPGDRLNTWCVYDSSERDGPTRFGAASDDEMCIDFIMYYPLLKTSNNRPFVYCSGITINDEQKTICGTELMDINNPSVKESATILEIDFGTPCSRRPDTNFYWYVMGGIIGISFVLIVIIITIVVIFKTNMNKYKTI